MASYRYPNLEFGIKRVPTEEPAQIERWSRGNFIAAGQDDFAQPPSQDPEMMERLINIMPVVDGTLQRRWGYSGWNQPTSQVNQLYSYQSDTTGSRAIIQCANSFVNAQNEDGSNYNTNIFNPTLTPRAVISRSYAFFASGNVNDRQKWDGGSLTTSSNWGIDKNNIAGLIAGPSPTTVVSDLGASGTTGSIGYLNPSKATTINGSTWQNPNNCFVQDKVYSSQILLVQTASGFLQATGYNFNIPTNATITGIQVSINRGCLPQANPNGGTFTGFSVDQGVFLLKNGTQVGTDHSSTNFWPIIFAGGSGGTQVYGSSTDLWGTTWLPSDVNGTASGFGAEVRAFNQETNPFFTSQVAVDWIGIKVFYTQPSIGSWTLPNNIIVQDGQVATAQANPSGTSELRTTGYSLTPSGTIISGIQVDIIASAQVSGSVPTLQPILVKNNAAYGTRKTASIPSPTLTTITFGGPNDLWGGVWTPTDINNANFGCQFFTSIANGASLVGVDYIQITVFSAVGPMTLSAPSGTGITLIQGRRYAIAFENSIAFNCSDITPFTASTGALSNQAQPITAIPVNADPQVDKKLLLATADGGNETRLYLVAELPNSQTTYTDTMPELTLLTQSVYLSTDNTGTEFGVPNNNRPPTGATLPTKHRGRIYLANKTTLFWSKNLAEVTTDTNTIAGRWEECWPAQNQLDVSEQAETIRGLLSDGINLYIGTEKKIRRIQGDAPFLEPPDIVHNEAGLINQNCWQITFIEGTPVGAMWLTPDKRIIGSDFNTYSDVGISIQNTLNTINSDVAAKTACAAFYSNGPFDLYILAVPTGSNIVNDTICVFNLKSKLWYIWQFSDNIASMLFNINFQGVPQLLFGTTGFIVYQLDSRTYQDRSNTPNVTPLNYTSTIRTSWLNLGDSTLRKVLNEIEVSTGDPLLQVTVEGSSTIKGFTSPNPVITAAPLVISPRGEFKVYLASSPSTDRQYRFTFVGTDTSQYLLNAMNVEAIPINRQ